MSKPIIAVSGITGAQGSSVADALLADGTYAIRGFSRDPNSEKSKALKAKGIEVVKADSNNFEELKTALEGVYGFFLLTNFWDPSVGHKEFEVGKISVDAAKAAGVKHVVASTLADCEKLSNGKYKVSHFTLKAKIGDYAKEQLTHSFVTEVGPSFYYQNFFQFFPPKEENGELVWTTPTTAILTAFDVSDTGVAVVSAFNNPKEWDRKFIALAGEHMSPHEYIKQFTEVTGKKARLVEVPNETFAKFGPGADEIADMFNWFNEYTYFGPNYDMATGRKANPHLKSFKQWLKESGHAKA